MSIPGAASPLFIGAAAADAAAYQVDRSLRFSSGDSAYLNRTPSSAGNRKTWTWSGWVKLCKNKGQVLFHSYSAQSDSGAFFIDYLSGGSLRVLGWSTVWRTTSAVFRDFSAWQHVVVAVDTTNATANDRIKVYVNGSQITDFSALNNPSQNADLAINQAATHRIGNYTDGSNNHDYLDGYLAEVHFVDGQALAPTDFGEYDSNNVWQPKEFAGTYGPLVNQSQDWSSGTYSGTTPGSGYEVAKAFNNVGVPGDSFGTGKLWGYYPGSATLTLPAAITLTASSTVELYTWHNTGSSGNITFTCSNGSVAVTPVDNANIASTVVSNPYTTFGASITAITVNSSGSDWTALAGIVVDGKLLVDSDVTVTDNSFYLKFADNSSNAALGTDSSGTSNTFTVNNLSATGITPPTATVVGDPTSSTDNPFGSGNGYSVDFDGNDEIRFTGPGTVTGDLTVECFYKMTSGSGYNRIFSTKEDSYSSEQTIIRRHTNGNLQFYFGNGTPEQQSGSISSGTWRHAAIVYDRSAGTVSYYDHGSRVGTDSYSSDVPITQMVAAGGYGSENFNGKISNARITKQALYSGSSYTVPTSTLTTTSQGATASNVTLLCCHQSSTTAVEGGNGSSADIDSLIDTPTNYTAGSGNNGGNYPTWNPLSQSSSTFSNGNLQATTSGGSGYPLETVNFYTPPGTGKWYWEFQLSALSGSNYTMVGMLPTDSDYQQGNSNTPKEAGGVQVYVGYDGDVDTATGAATAGTDTATFGVGDILGWAFDAENGTVKCYKNGVAQGTQFTSVRTDVGWAFCVTDYDNSATATYIINFGQRPFAYTPPTGYLSLCTTNLPDPTIADGSTAFDVALWTGNGTSQTISGLNFSPDLVWNKSRSTTRQNHLVDTVRGTGKRLFSDSTEVENSASTNLTAFNSDGFDLGSSADVNQNGTTFVGWTWDAGTSTVSNTDGSITSNVRANASAGFSIATYTGNGTINSTVGHGLNAAPSLVIIKNRSNSYNWAVLHTSVGTTGTTLDGSAEYYMLQLDGNAARNNFTNDNIWNPTNTTVKVNGEGTANWVNANGDNYVMYSWTPIDQYSSFGSYQGNGSTDGPFVYTGHRSQFLLVKQSSASGEDWWIVDTARETFNAQDQILLPNSSNSEITTSNPIIDILSNGFKLRNTNARFNASGATYVFASFASHPFKTARAR